jgi:hypothetical protein
VETLITGVTRQSGHTTPAGWSHAPRHNPTVGSHGGVCPYSQVTPLSCWRQTDSVWQGARPHGTQDWASLLAQGYLARKTPPPPTPLGPPVGPYDEAVSYERGTPVRSSYELLAAHFPRGKDKASLAGLAVRTGSLTGPPRGKRAPRIEIGAWCHQALIPTLS